MLGLSRVAQYTGKVCVLCINTIQIRIGINTRPNNTGCNGRPCQSTKSPRRGIGLALHTQSCSRKQTGCANQAYSPRPVSVGSLA